MSYLNAAYPYKRLILILTPFTGPSVCLSRLVKFYPTLSIYLGPPTFVRWVSPTPLETQNMRILPKV